MARARIYRTARQHSDVCSRHRACRAARGPGPPHSANPPVGARVSPGFSRKTVLKYDKSEPLGTTVYVRHVLCMPERLVVRGLHVTPTRQLVLGSVPDSRVRAFFKPRLRPAIAASRKSEPSGSTAHRAQSIDCACRSGSRARDLHITSTHPSMFRSVPDFST